MSSLLVPGRSALIPPSLLGVPTTVEWEVVFKMGVVSRESASSGERDEVEGCVCFNEGDLILFCLVVCCSHSPQLDINGSLSSFLCWFVDKALVSPSLEGVVCVEDCQVK